jgi:hypothetical protein
MKTLIRTIIVLAALSLLTAAFAQAQTSRPEVPPVVPSGPSTQPPVPTPSIPAPAPVPTPPTLPTSASVDLVKKVRSLSFGSRSGSAGTVLVIPSQQTRTEDLIAINEDMNVMSRIFEKNLEQDRIKTATSNIFLPGRRNAYGILLGSSRGQIQSMYLQGFGALFLMNVDFPLTPPSEVQEEEKETQKAEQGDPVWQQTRQQMFEPEKVDRRRRTDRPEEKYDAEKVENLKTTLIKALKHAANIRSLKPDESVILTVAGSGQATGTTIATARVLPGEGQMVIVEKDAYGTKTQKIVPGTSLENIGLSSPSVLVIRTKKSNIDEFSKGDLDFEKFRQLVKLLTYPLLGGADGYGSHFSPYTHLRSTSSSSRR